MFPSFHSGARLYLPGACRVPSGPTWTLTLPPSSCSAPSLQPPVSFIHVVIPTHRRCSRRRCSAVAPPGFPQTLGSNFALTEFHGRLWRLRPADGDRRRGNPPLLERGLAIVFILLWWAWDVLTVVWWRWGRLVCPRARSGCYDARDCSFLWCPDWTALTADALTRMLRFLLSEMTLNYCFLNIDMLTLLWSSTFWFLVVVLFVFKVKFTRECETIGGRGVVFVLFMSMRWFYSCFMKNSCRGNRKHLEEKVCWGWATCRGRCLKALLKTSFHTRFPQFLNAN